VELTSPRRAGNQVQSATLAESDPRYKDERHGGLDFRGLPPHRGVDESGIRSRSSGAAARRAVQPARCRRCSAQRHLGP